MDHNFGFSHYLCLALSLLMLVLPRASQARDFYMGFGSWPSDLTPQAVSSLKKFQSQNADITLQQFGNGVPWDEALGNKPYPKHLRDDWVSRKTAIPEGHKLFIALNSLNMQRNGLAEYWSNKGDNQPLPKKWANKKFNDPEVMAAYTNYVLKAVEYFQPDYLATSIESNVLVSNAIEKVEDFGYLHAHVYKAVKEKYPDLPVFTTIQYEHLRGIDDSAKKNLAFQKNAVTSFMWFSDYMGLSTYKFGPLHPNPISDAYFDEALTYNKPIAITESGALSRDITVDGMTLTSSEEEQKKFIQMELNEAAENNFVFVINWAAIDFDPLVKRLPQAGQDLASYWMYTGLQTSAGQDKEALGVWRAYLNE